MASLGDTGNEAPAIRIVRKKKGGDGHHGGAWKVAYADFVTAMMAFFLVMWIVGLNKPVRMQVANYFKNPSLFNTTGANHLIIGAETPPSAAPPPIQKIDPSSIKAVFKAKAAAILDDLNKNPEFQGIADSIDVKLTEEGLRIELMEKKSALFFATGSAQLKPRTVRLLQLIAHELRDLKNPIIVEGHTDSRPLDGPNGYSNWELSEDRANSARRAMEEHGLRQGQVLCVRGFADKKLLKPDEPTHFSNRRVSILVAYTGAGGFSDVGERAPTP